MNQPINITYLPLSRPATRSVQTGNDQGTGAGFQKLLSQALGDQTFHVSGHAEKRLQERHITLDSRTRGLLNEALDELSAKGAKDSLVLTKDAAFVMNVPSRTLVTAMDLSEARNRIVTQIDSVALKNV